MCVYIGGGREGRYPVYIIMTPRGEKVKVKDATTGMKMKDCFFIISAMNCQDIKRENRILRMRVWSVVPWCRGFPVR